jgi:hypothetical protein
LPAPQVKTASAKQQQKDDQQHYYIHGAFLSDFGYSIMSRLSTVTISHDSGGWLFRIAHHR